MLAALAFAGGAQAQSAWTNPGLADWFDAGNWSAGVPDGTVSAVINNGGVAEVSAPGATANELRVGHDANGGLYLHSGGTLLVNQTSYVGDGSGSLGQVVVDGAGSAWGNTEGDLFFGNYGAAEMLVSNGGAVITKGTFVGVHEDAQAVVTIDGAGSSWDIAGILVAGASGSAQFTIRNGGTLSSRYTLLGSMPGSQVTMTVDGAGSSWSATDTSIGLAGDARLTILNGGLVSTNTGYVGYSGGQGTVLVDGAGSRWDSRSGVQLSSSGQLTIQNGGAVTTDAGATSLVDGTAWVDGAGSRWTDGGSLTVGKIATGQLMISNGGAVSSDVGVLGEDVGGSGMVSVDGADSRLSQSAHLEVGRNGSGQLAIVNGGTVISGTSAYIGMNAGSQGSVQVDGDGSSLAIGGEFMVGRDGTGTLILQNGGDVVSDEWVRVGLAAGSGGTVRVDGAGSNWSSGDLYLGYQGTADLTISNGGLVSNTRVVMGSTPDSQVTAIVDGAGSRWESSGDLAVGHNSLLTIQYGGTVVSGFNSYISHNAAAVVDGADSAWHSAEFVVGLEGAGTGTLAIRNGGGVLSAGGYVGGRDNSSGAAVVDGVGSHWTNSRDLIVGDSGAGQVTISDGGTVTNVNGAIGNNRLSSGTVLVDGAGSRWSNGGELAIGNRSTGALTIANGGSVSAVGQAYVARDADAVGTLSIGAAAGDAAVGAGTFEAARLAFGDGAGTLVFNHTQNDYAFGTTIVGNGTIDVFAGTTALTGANSNGGAVNVRGGTLRVEGTLGDAATTVFAGGTLDGSGSIAGGVTVQDGGILAPGSSAGTLTLGSLTLSDGSILDYELGQAGVIGGGVNDLIEINGDLTLDGTLDITDIGGFGAGVYRLMNYGGALTDNGLAFGTLPTEVGVDDLLLQTAIDGQVNLVSSAGAILGFWDGGDASLHDDGAIAGGDGAWDDSNRNWAEADGALNGPWHQDFAVFGGQAGTVTVVGAQLFTGLQFMTDGYRLVAGSGGALQTDGAETVIRVDPNVSAEIVAPITGSGGLVKTDTGTLVLSGVNIYSGGTAIDMGTLQVSADNNLGDAAGALSLDGGTLRNTAAFTTTRAVTLEAGGGTFETAADLTIAGTIDGAGALAKTGDGTLALTGDNTYGGGTRVLAGTLVGDAASIRGDLANDGIVVFDQGSDASFDGAIAGSGDMVKRGAGALTLGAASALDWTIDAGALIARAAQFGGDAAITDGATLRFTEAGGSYAGTLSGAGTFEVAGGETVLALTADSSAFGGTTSLESGTLRIDGALGGLTIVAAGATLGGTGRLSDVDNAGTVAAGNSIGTLTLTGDYIHRDDATLLAEIEPGGTNDLLDIAGTATIEGGTVDIIKLPGQYEGGTRYTLIDAAGGVTGTFDTLDQDLPFLDLLLVYDPGHVYLDVVRNDVDFDIVCGDGTFNQCEVAGALDLVGEDETITPDLEAVLTEVTTLTLNQARAGFDRLSGEAHASLAGAVLEGHALYGQTVTRRIADRREAFGADRLHGGAWVRGYGSASDLDGDGNAHGADVDVHGIAAGVDAWGGESWLIGASVNALKVDADFREGDSGEADAKNLALYTSVQGERAYLDAMASYAWWDNEVQRRIEVGTIARETRSEYGTHRFALALEAGLSYDLGGSTLQPLVSVEHSLLSTEGFREDGADDVDLIGSAQNVKRTVAGLGVRWSGGFGGGAWTFAPTAQLRWLHTYGDLDAEFDVAFAGAPEIGYRVRGVTVPEDRGLLGVGLLARRDNLDLFVDLDYQAGDGYEAGSLGAGLRWRW